MESGPRPRFMSVPVASWRQAYLSWSQHVMCWTEFGGRSWFRGSEHNFLAFAGVKTREIFAWCVLCGALSKRYTNGATTGT